MKSMRLIISYFRFASQIVLLLLILSPALARGLEDKIVFVSKHNGTLEVFLVEGLDGRPIQLTRNRFASWPSISPDGTEVVFVSHPPDRLSNILILHLATNRIEKLTNNGKFNTEYRHLDWSPDSQHILYSVDDFGVPDHVGLRELFITDDNGNRVKKVEQDLTPIESLQRSIMPTWSPKRSEITYFGFVATNQPPPNPWQIYSMNLNDGSITALTSGGAEDRFPWAWRPDGQKILFIISSPSDEEVRWSHIYVMDPDGENMINLTQASKAGATWSPDGKQIAFRLNEVQFS